MEGLLAPILKKFPGAAPAPALSGFPTELTYEDLRGGATDDITLIKNQFIPIGGKDLDGFRVPAQTRVMVGSGGPQGAGHNQGYLSVALRSDNQSAAPAWVDGTLRIVSSDFNGQIQRTMFESRLTQLRSTVTAETGSASVDSLDINKMVAFPLRTDIVAEEDDLIIVQVKVAADGLKIDASTSQIIRIPMTRFYLR